jgi:hypothetical protein
MKVDGRENAQNAQKAFLLCPFAPFVHFRG